MFKNGVSPCWRADVQWVKVVGCLQAAVVDKEAVETWENLSLITPSTSTVLKHL